MAPTLIPPAPPDNTAVIQNVVRETAKAIRGQAIEERDRLTSGMANTVGELVRNMQGAHKQGVSELLNNLNRGFAPAVTDLFQSDNRHVTLQDQRQVHMHDQRQIHIPRSASTDPNPPMAIEQPAAAPAILSAEGAGGVVPSKIQDEQEGGTKE